LTSKHVSQSIPCFASWCCCVVHAAWLILPLRHCLDMLLLCHAVHVGARGPSALYAVHTQRAHHHFLWRQRPHQGAVSVTVLGRLLAVISANVLC
jgi:hypothetical protein